MTDLIAKLEALTGPDREVDAEIALAVFGGEIIWKQQNYTMEQYPVRKFASKNHVGGIGEEPVEPHTASIDAAMTLPSKGRVFINIAEDGITTALADGTEGTAFNAATAVVIAKLRAALEARGLEIREKAQ